MMAKVKNNEAEQVIVFSFSRFARSTMHLLKGLQTFKEHKTRFVSITEQIDTDSHLGLALFTILGSLAQLERSMIQERVKAGMRNVKMKGKIIGRVRKRNDALIHSLLKNSYPQSLRTSILGVTNFIIAGSPCSRRVTR